MSYKNQDRNVTPRAIKLVQESEFAVLSSITVREEYKVKLRALISIISAQIRADSSPGASKSHINANQKCVGHQFPEVAEGKEIHVLGDLLLLTRAASVDVVENIQTWREVVHDGIPRPYIYNHENYLLSMCEDLDFLDQDGYLVEWLGFRLVRNPLLVDKALDDIVSSRLATSVHDERSLKYWNSASWRQNNKLASKRGSPVSVVFQPNLKARWKKQPPPQPLVKPLLSISPEDDVVDGSRIAAAQEILLDEESFHGRWLALKAASEYMDRGPSIFERIDVDNSAEPPALYDAMAALNSQLKKTEYRSSLLRRERAQVERTLQDLRNQMNWTELCRDCDRANNHRAWHCGDLYRQEALKLYAKMAEKLQHCLAVLMAEDNYFNNVSDKCKCRMSELRVEKEKQRVARHNKKREEEVAKREGILKKPQARTSLLQPKKTNPQKCRQSIAAPEKPNTIHEGFEADFESDIRVILNKKSSIREDLTKNHQLKEKRQRSIDLKQARLEQEIRLAKEKELMLDQRRAENVAMKWEDALSQAVEFETKRRAQVKARKQEMDRVASCAMFKCTHEMNGKRFFISVYTQHARGYELEGLRFVAYDPSSSATFSLVMTRREFTSLGYGRTSTGLKAFCHWLCLLYDKRRRQFRLVWSGPPCSPPLRVCEDDQTLICVHKEGVKTRSSSLDNYSLVAVYLRTDARSALRFVLGSWHVQDFLLTEHVVAAHRLVLGSDLAVHYGAAGRATIIWKHDGHKCQIEEHSQTEDTMTATSSVVNRQRIYSSEIVVNRVKYTIHMYDTNETKYALELTPKSRKGESVPEVTRSSMSKLVLYKQEVNPYNVHLTSSNFADFISLVRFEQMPILEVTKEHGKADNYEHVTHFKWRAAISPKWTDQLASYVRVQRLTKYACKISGVFCFIVIFIVQHKSEFRAHLLLEITWLAPTLSSNLLGGGPIRHSVRIALSDYLRCGNTLRRFALVNSTI